MKLLLRAGARHYLRHPWQVGLAVLGVALGVAVAISIELANGSALRAFELSSQAVAGRATHQIVGGSAGVPESLYRRLRVELGERAAAPVLEGVVETGGGAARLRLLGVDPLAESGFRGHLGGGALPRIDLEGFLVRRGALLAPGRAAVLGLEVGDRWSVRAGGRRHELELVGSLEAGEGFERRALDDLLVVDLSTAQEVLSFTGRLTRVDLAIHDDGDGGRRLAAIRALLPAGLSIVRPESRSAAAADMTRAFRLNLRALSLLGALCGFFLIYNTMTFAVVERRPLFGTLRALGVGRRDLFATILAEAAAVGLVGALAGAAGGVWLARRLLGRVTQTINDLYFSLEVGTVAASPGQLLAAVGLGVAATVLAATGPALEALAIRPRSALERAELESRAHRAVPRAAAAGVVLAALGLALTLVPGRQLLPAFAALFLVLVGLALLGPLATVGLMRLLAAPAAAIAGSLGRLAARGVVAALSRTAIAIVALAMAVSVSVGVDIMISSFRSTVADWLATVLPADLYVTAPAALADRFATAPAVLDAAAVAALRDLGQVERVDTVRHAAAGSDRGPLRLAAYDLGTRGRAGFRFARGDEGAAWTALDAGSGAIATEPLAYRLGLELGDGLSLDTPAGRRRLEIVAVVYDYAREEGSLLVSHALYGELWGDDSASAASLWLAPGADSERVRGAVEATLGGERELAVRSNGELRAESLRVFDRTFQVTGVLRLLAVAVAFVGVLSALTALQLERARELAVLRALGLTPGQVWGLITSQTALMGLAAGLLSLPLGLAMAAILVRVINRRSFGWSLDLRLDPAALAAAVGLALSAALVAGLYPAWKMSRTGAAAALRAE